MGTSLAIIESGMDRDIMPRAANMLAVVPEVAPVAFKAAFMESLYKNPKIGETCTLQSIYMSATTFAAFGVLPGPFLGQGWLIPRKDHGVWKCQGQLGYKGLNTIAGRGGRTIEADVIRRTDKYEIRKGTNPVINVWPNLEAPENDPILCAYSMQEFQGRRVSPIIIPMKELMAIRDKNSKAAGSDDAEGTTFSPWNDKKVGLPAMCQKTATLRQRRTMPMGLFHYAGALDDLQEQGQTAWVIPRDDGGLSIMTGSSEEIRQPTNQSTTESDDILTDKLDRPEFIVKRSTKDSADLSCIEDWKREMLRMISNTKPVNVKYIRDFHVEIMEKLTACGYGLDTTEVSRAMAAREMEN